MGPQVKTLVDWPIQSSSYNCSQHKFPTIIMVMASGWGSEGRGFKVELIENAA